MSPLVKKALRGLAAPASRAGRNADDAALPTGSAVLKPLPMDEPVRSTSPVLRPLATDEPGPAVLRPLPTNDEPAEAYRPGAHRPRPTDDAGPAVLRALPMDDDADAAPPARRPAPIESSLEDEDEPARPSAYAARPMPEPTEDPQSDDAPEAHAPSREDEAPVRPSRVPRPALTVGLSFVATLLTVTLSQLASAVLAAAAAAGSMYVIAGIVSPGVAAIPAFCVFAVVLLIWAPAAIQLASGSAWRTTLREQGIARGVAEGIAWTILPRPRMDGLVTSDPAGLGMYGLRERVRLALEQSLYDSVKTGWVRRTVSGVAAARTDEAMHRLLGPVEGFGQLDRDGVRKTLTNAIESALVGKT